MPTYFLTGANRGIGLEFVRQLSQDTANTIIGGVRSLQAAGTEIWELSKNQNVHLIECDVSSLDSISAISSSVGDILSQADGQLNYIFNIAGINATSSDTSLTLDPTSMHHHITTNVLGPAKIVEALAKYLAPGAIILNMTSGLGSLTVATDVTKCCTYSISKAALNMLTVHQAKDLRGRAVVICVDPGWVKTRLGGAGATEEPEDSVKGILGVVGGLKEGDSGRFFHAKGHVVPW